MVVVPLQQRISLSLYICIYEHVNNYLYELRECQFDREVCRQLCMIDGILKLFKSCELLFIGREERWRGGGEGVEIQLAWNINNGISEI